MHLNNQFSGDLISYAANESTKGVTSFLKSDAARYLIEYYYYHNRFEVFIT